LRPVLQNFTAFALSISYIYAVNVLCDGFDCFDTPDGVKLRADPTVFCDTQTHRRFQRLALGCIIGIGAGVPLLYALWIHILRRWARATNVASHGGPLLKRPTWTGLGDPSTRASWGPLYEMYRFSSAFDEVPLSDATPLLQRARIWLLHHLAPSFESTLLLQKLLIVLVTNLVPDKGASRALAQIGVHAASAALIAWLQPFQRLDVRVPVLVWTPVLPPSLRPHLSAQAQRELEAARAADLPAAEALRKADPGTEDYRTHRCKLFGIACGWAWVTHLLVADALNHTAISTSLVQIVNLASALLAAGGGARALGVALIGINCCNILLALAAWLTCAICWSVNTKLLLEIADRHEAKRTGVDAAALRDKRKRGCCGWLDAAVTAASDGGRSSAENLELEDTIQLVLSAGAQVRLLEARGKLNDAAALKVRAQ
jgi:hypothetical protein